MLDEELLVRTETRVCDSLRAQSIHFGHTTNAAEFVAASRKTKS